MVRTYFRVFIASAICCWYLERSRLTKAVMARILGLAGSGGRGVEVVARWAPAVVAKRIRAKRVTSARSRCRDIFELAPTMGKDTSGERGGGREKRRLREGSWQDAVKSRFLASLGMTVL